MRIALLSSTKFGLRCLRNGIASLPNMEVVGILTTPRIIPISYSATPIEIQTHADFSDAAAGLGCDLAVENGPLRSRDYLKHITRWDVDLILALGWYYNIPVEVRDAARMGCAGIHASLLPKYRGGAPINWAIINGEAETGVTFFYFTDEIDAGDIIAQASFEISPHDTCATAYDKAEEASIAILRQTLPRLANGTAPRVPQEQSLATTFPQRKPQDGLIDWSWPPQQLRDFIRAQTRPYPGAFFFVGDKKITIWDATIEATK